MNLTELLAGLKEEYIAALPERIAEIKKQYATLNTTALTTEFHKLKGTGTTYGIPEISTLGEVIEAKCLLNPDEVNSYIPIAIDLLEAIYQSRINSESFNLSKDKRFTTLEANS